MFSCVVGFPKYLKSASGDTRNGSLTESTTGLGSLAAKFREYCNRSSEVPVSGFQVARLHRAFEILSISERFSRNAIAS